MTDSIDAPTLPRRRLRLSIRGLLLLIAFVAVVMCLTQFWLANRSADLAALSYQMSVLADPGASVESRLGAVDGMSQAKGRQARRALRLLSASLDDPDPRIRASAARVLGRLGSQVIVDGGTSGIDTVRPSAEALLDLIGDPDSLGASSSAIQALQFLNSADADQRPVPDELIAEKLRNCCWRAGRRSIRKGETLGCRRSGACHPGADRSRRPLLVAARAGRTDRRFVGPRSRSLCGSSNRGRPRPGRGARRLFLVLDVLDPEVRMIAIWNCCSGSQPEVGVTGARVVESDAVARALLEGDRVFEGDDA